MRFPHPTLRDAFLSFNRSSVGHRDGAVSGQANYGNIYQAIIGCYDVVMRSHHRRKIDFRRGVKQGPCDQIVEYLKPDHRPIGMSKRDYQKCPKSISVRHVRYAVKRMGFRVRHIILATTLQLHIFKARLASSIVGNTHSPLFRKKL